MTETELIHQIVFSVRLVGISEEFVRPLLTDVT